MFKLLIISLTIFSAAFPMSKEEQDINRFYNTGENLVSEEAFFDAAFWFAKAAKIDLPDPGGPLGDPYKAARGKKQDAIKKIAYIALQLEKDQKYDEALKIYQELPDTFSAQIKKIELIKKDWEQLAQAKILITQNEYDQALQILTTLKAREINPKISNEANQLETQISISQQKATEVIRQEQERLAQTALQQKLVEVGTLINAENYDEASNILDTLPADNQKVIKFREEVSDEKEIERAREVANDDNYQEAYKILNPLKDKGILKANTLDQQLIQEQLTKATDSAKSGNYADAYAILNILKANRPSEKVQKTETDIKARQQAQEEEAKRKASEEEKKRLTQEEVERQKQLAQEAQRAQEERRKTEEAEKQKLAEEKRKAEELQRQAQQAEEQRKAEEAKKQRLAQEEIERQKQIEEIQRKALEEAQKEKASDKPLAKDLNNAFNYLAEKLTLITKYIAENPTGSKTTHLLETPTRFRPRPPGRAASIKRLSQQ